MTWAPGGDDAQRAPDPRTRMESALNRLAKWRSFFAGWQLGTRTKHDPESAAIRNHREATMILRAEVTALTRLLLETGTITDEQLLEAVAEEADALSASYAAAYPGVVADDRGLILDARAADTMARMNFKP